MFSYIKDFVSRHRKKIIFGVVVGGAILGTRYAQRKFIEWQEKETKEFLERTRKQHYFESTEKTCNQTIVFLSSTLRVNITNQVNCEEIIQKLRENPSNKVELWEELKVLVFTKVSLLVYSGALLVIALRIQLNIIGGHIYYRMTAPGGDLRDSNDLQERYLSKCHYLLNEGLKVLYPLIREKVGWVLRDVNLTQNLTLQSLENMFWAIQSSINSDSRDPMKNMPHLLYGCSFEEEDTFVKDMMVDTNDLLESTEVVNLATSCISRGFSNAIDRISEFFLPDQNGTTLGEFPSTSREVDNVIQFSHPNNLSKPFAKILPIINGFGKLGATSDLPEPWISPFIYMDRVNMLGANIYESYSCPRN